MVPVEKIPEPTQSLAGCHHPLCNVLAGGWRTGAEHNLEAGGAQRRDFFNQAWNSPPTGIEPRPGGATVKL
jgi:hypothetical protein